jgi:hypothetical protein
VSYGTESVEKEPGVRKKKKKPKQQLFQHNEEEQTAKQISPQEPYTCW